MIRSARMWEFGVLSTCSGDRYVQTAGFRVQEVWGLGFTGSILRIAQLPKSAMVCSRCVIAKLGAQGLSWFLSGL